ncbi:molybdopterin-synthase adenylyltransferase MoeB [Pleomorphovibrio marinus]|uniref:molybdopterin-synthase adenylyltransferase MoeB n=1 Tax=Pleomorphovibrio marinus TaxID=2164132 RepID=UPI000E0BF761|nr:molybdopterin-synthase adenylyltransferase MoeB [Pleomorphovibrio marinus]
MAKVFIPTPLRKFTDQQSDIAIAGATVSEILEQLVERFPSLKQYLITSDGQLPPFINVFVGEEDIRNLQRMETEVSSDTLVSIIPAIAGGSEGVILSKKELARYDRHITIPEFGLEGQIKLKSSKVLVIGSGGLGSPLLLYLAAAGVGHIGIVDFDSVQDSNLHRQVLFGEEEVGMPKVDAAKKKLESLNPYITIKVYKERFSFKNALSLVEEYDVVADGTDNFPTRYLVNDVCVLKGKTNIYASIFQFEGQVSVFNFKDRDGNIGPNYRDLYESPPPLGLVPSCAEGGVLGVLPGIIGSMQALEVIKVITGVGQPLSGKLFTFDALSFSSRTFMLKKNPSNPLTGKTSIEPSLFDYEHFCGFHNHEIKEITAEEFRCLMGSGEDYQLVDVREAHEYYANNLSGILIPMGKILNCSHQIRRDVKVIIHCKAGGRSARAIRSLEEEKGYENLYNLKGGIEAVMACKLENA